MNLIIYLKITLTICQVVNIINKVCGAVIIFYGCKLIWNFVQLMGWVK